MACSLVNPRAHTITIASSGGADPVGVAGVWLPGGTNGLEKSTREEG